MKILSAQQIKDADEYAISDGSISSLALMQRAAEACYTWIVNHYNKTHLLSLFCGSGNNGADGLVIARMLQEAGYAVNVYITSENGSENFKKNLSRINNAKHFSEWKQISNYNEIIVDAIFGVGLNKPVSGIFAEQIYKINAAQKPVISVDIPSGLYADKSSFENTVINATYSLTFQALKLAFLFAENAKYTGEIITIDIGLQSVYNDVINSDKQITNAVDVRKIIKARGAFSHKGIFGHAMLISGSYGKMGAAVLAGTACLRTGAGLVTIQAPACGYEILQTSVPEAMVLADDENIISSSLNYDKYNAVGIGPGIGTAPVTAKVLENILSVYHNPLVLDADAINILSDNKFLLAKLPAQTILTPHLKEFERLAGTSQNDFERHELQIRFSREYDCYVVLKGRYSCISTPDGNSYFNSTGNPGMAKAGTGDTLTGMITAMLSQGYSSKESCIAAVYLHGLAADIAVKDIGEHSLLATDIIKNIGRAFLYLENQRL